MYCDWMMRDMEAGILLSNRGFRRTVCAASTFKVSSSPRCWMRLMRTVGTQRNATIAIRVWTLPVEQLYQNRDCTRTKTNSSCENTNTQNKETAAARTFLSPPHCITTCCCCCSYAFLALGRSYWICARSSRFHLVHPCDTENRKCMYSSRLMCAEDCLAVYAITGQQNPSTFMSHKKYTQNKHKHTLCVCIEHSNIGWVTINKKTTFYCT